MLIKRITFIFMSHICHLGMRSGSIMEIGEEELTRRATWMLKNKNQAYSSEIYYESVNKFQMYIIFIYVDIYIYCRNLSCR